MSNVSRFLDAGVPQSGTSSDGTVRAQVFRAPRFNFDLPVRFYSIEGIVSGRCMNISESGVLVQFENAVDVWLRGELLITTGTQHIQVNVRVARVDGNEAGLSFHICGEEDKTSIEKLLVLAANKTTSRTESG